MKRIAILTDSCCDVPPALIDKKMFIVPLEVHYSDGVYLDGVSITPDDVYRRFSQEVPKTSLPSGEAIKGKLDEIVAEGYEKVVVISISSGLSGTLNMMRLVSLDYPHIEFIYLDTKNIGIGAGMSVIRVNELIDQGLELSEIETIMLKQIQETKVFFCVSTLEYLQKGGRIGLVSATLGNMLDLKPIISCNDDGVYYTVAKQRGRKRSLSKCVEIASKFLSECDEYNIGVVNGDGAVDAEKVKATLLGAYGQPKHLVEGQISPVLVVHTGPGLVGVCVQRIINKV